MIEPKRFDIFSPLTGGCSEGLDAFRFFSKYPLVLVRCTHLEDAALSACLKAHDNVVTAQTESRLSVW